MGRHDWLAMLAHLGGFAAVLVILATMGECVHRNRRRGRLWAALETLRRYLCNEEES